MLAISLAYHDVVSRGLEQHSPLRSSIYTIRHERFSEHLRAIGSSIGADRVCRIREAGQWESRVPVFLTFDDGGACAYLNVAGELERLNWYGHFFVVADWIGRPAYMNRIQIQALYRRGHVIGSHSCSHPERMSHLSHRELIHEWRDSRVVIEDIVGDSVKTASVAGGYYSSKVGATAAECGLEVLFTSEPTATIHEQDGCLVLGRYAIRRATTAATVAGIVGGNKGPRLRQAGLWAAAKAFKGVTGAWFPVIRRAILARTPEL